MPPTASVSPRTNTPERTVEDPGYIDLAKRYGYKAYAVLTREFALYRIATASSLTDKVLWALISTSCCGPEVREGCFLRKEKTGELVRDEKEQLYPIRVKHLLSIIKVGDECRGNVHRAIAKFIKQKFIEVRGPDKIWYLLLDPSKLQDLLKNCKTGCYQKNSNEHYTFLPQFLRKVVTHESVNQDAIDSHTIKWLEDHNEDYKKAARELRERYAADAKLYLSASASLVTEDLEDIEEETHTPPTPSQPPEPPLQAAVNGVCEEKLKTPPKEEEPKPSPKEPTFDPKPSWQTFWHTYTDHEHAKVGRQQDAWFWWLSNVKTDEHAAEIIAGTWRHRASRDWINGIGIQYAINFLTQRRYTEHPKPPPASETNGKSDGLAWLRRRAAGDS